MDQTKIGRFIQSSRKQINMTQKELADKLGVSDKLISKWETGNGMPDISILNELCSTLNISVNELLSGETLPPEKYSEKAEENIMELLKKNNTNKKAYIIQLIAGIVFFIAAILLMAVTTYGAEPRLVNNYIDGPSLVIVVALIFASVLIAGTKTVKGVFTTIRKTAIPVGVLTMVFEMIGLFYSADTLVILLVGLAVAVIPLLYALGIFMIALLVEIKLNKEA
ncbi:MAG: helix-turn-helix domain-containing protein [Lachnospiraceae bacterium]|nr:helix-turn-helix domain-containing protein [Lachnospiraceae bacterium]